MLLTMSSEKFQVLNYWRRTLADLHIQKLKKGKAKGNYLPGKSQGRQILMNVLILLFAAVLQDKTGMGQGDYFSEPFVFII